MSGRDSLRGFTIQVLSILIDSLNTDDPWVSVRLEPIVQRADSTDPSVVTEKADVIWAYDHGVTKATQIKHSTGSIEKPDMQKWAAELEAQVKANEYELVTFGVFSDGAAQVTQHGAVRVRKPQPLELAATSEQAAHRLALYVERRGLKLIPPRKAATIVDQLRARLQDLSTQGKTVTRDAFDYMLRAWVLDADSSLQGTEEGQHAAGALERAQELRHLAGAKGETIDNMVRIAVAPLLHLPLLLDRHVESGLREQISTSYGVSLHGVVRTGSDADFSGFRSLEEPEYPRLWRVTSDAAPRAAGRRAGGATPQGPVVRVRQPVRRTRQPALFERAQLRQGDALGPF